MSPLPDLTIGFLADHPEVVPTLVDWFEREWAPYYGPGGPGDAATDLAACERRDTLPIGLVALVDGEPAGTAALREDSVTTHRHLGPWLAALVVAPEHRGLGIGSQLVAGIEALATERGFRRLYVGVDRATALVTRRGWRFLERGPYFVSDVSIYWKDLGDTNQGEPT